DSHNTLITDIGLVQGTPTYIATFVIRKPKDMSLASGVMWHDVPNRGGDVGFNTDSFAANDVQLLSGWQGDNAGGTSVPANASCVPPYVAPCAQPTFPHHYVVTPVLTGVTGKILGRIINRSGNVAAPLNVMGNPIPYFPVDATKNSSDTLTIHTHETLTGVVTEGGTVPNSDWKYCATGGSFANAGTVTSLPVNVCMKNGFDGTKLYQLVYNAKNPYVGVAGIAAFRGVQPVVR